MATSYILLRRLVLVCCAVVFIGGCGFWSKKAPVDEATPAELMSKGMEDFETGYYQGATESFKKLTERYPYSKFAVDAELKMADALFHTKLYDEAIQAYASFERLHPKHKQIPYVIYQRGMCGFERIGDIDRDQSHTLLAKEQFERLVSKFPRHEYALKAREHIRDCYTNLAEYELYVGRFYFEREKYRAAKTRFRYVLENYPDLGQYHDAIEYMALCEQRLEEQGPEPAEGTDESDEAEKTWVDKVTSPFTSAFKMFGSLFNKTVQGVKGIF